MSYFVAISGSPARESRSAILIQYLKSGVEKEGLKLKEVSVLDFQPELLIQGQFDHPSLTKFTEQLKGASGIIIVSPVYKAAYTGALKALLDILPQDIFKGKPVFPLMVGGSQAHLLAIEYSLKPLLAALSAQNILKGVYVIDKNIDRTNLRQPITDLEVQRKVDDQLVQFIGITQEYIKNDLV